MNLRPLVSICIPCYNHYKYLDDCFESLIMQTYDNIEIIILDDYSKDKSIKKINQWIPKLKIKFKRVLFIKHLENKGISKSCNELIINSKGKYIKFLASDDALNEDCIENCVIFLESNRKCQLLYGNMYVVNENFNYKLKNKFIKREYRAPFMSSKKNSFENLLQSNFIPAPAVIFRKTCFEFYGLFNQNLMFEDYEYWLRVSRRVKIIHLEKFLCYYRLTSTSLSRSKRNKLDIINCTENFIKRYSNYSNNKLYIMNNFYKRAILYCIQAHNYKYMYIYIYKLGLKKFLTGFIFDKVWRKTLLKNLVMYKNC